MLGQLGGEPGTTFSTAVGAEREFVTLQSACAGCLPDLTTRPPTLSFQDLTTTGTVSAFQGIAGQDGKYVDVTVHTTTSATLTQVAPCDVRFEDMVALNFIAGPNEGDGGLELMTDAGDELVWKLDGSPPVHDGHALHQRALREEERPRHLRRAQFQARHAFAVLRPLIGDHGGASMAP